MKKTIIRSLVSVIFAFVIAFQGLACLSAGAIASNVSKKTTSHDIAVVFDNSGSMYRKEGKESWCRAKYAMEIFASMLNFAEGDKMTIYPMWYVSTTETPAKESKAVEPVSISSTSDLKKITYMYTPCSDGKVNTPFEPVEEAYSDLKQSTCDEKWLIVLTDGTFNLEKRNQEKDENFTKEKLKNGIVGKASDSIKVQYLAIGTDIEDDADLEEYENGKTFFSTVADNTDELTDEMVNICNRIFQRKTLDNKYLSRGSKKLNLEVSMNQLIVFVAGDGASVKSLTAADGTKVEILNDSGVRKCSPIKYSHGKQLSGDYDTDVDKSLYGQVVTFSECPAGEYTLDYTGKNIQIFYEPKIEIDIKVSRNPDGTDIMEPNSEGEVKTLEEGDYYVFYDLVDGINHNPVTDKEIVDCEDGLSALVVFTDESGNKVGEHKLGSSGDAVGFVENQTVYFEIKGTYLDDYEISTSDDAKSFTFKIVKATTLKAKATASQTWYQTGKEEKWETIKVEATIGSEKLTKKVFDECRLLVKFSPEITYWVEGNSEESCYYVHLGMDDSKKIVTAPIGNYVGEFSVVCTNDNEKINPSKIDKVKFEVRSYPFWYRIAAAVLSILLLVGIILFIMSRKAMPKDIKIVPDSTEFKVGTKKIEGVNATVKYSRKLKTLTVKTPEYDIVQGATGGVTFTLVPIDRLWTPSKNRRVTVVGISTTGSVDEIELLGIDYVRSPKTRKWTDSAYLDDDSSDAVRPINQNIRNATISLIMRDGRRVVSSMDCDVKHK